MSVFFSRQAPQRLTLSQDCYCVFSFFLQERYHHYHFLLLLYHWLGSADTLVWATSVEAKFASSVVVVAAAAVEDSVDAVDQITLMISTMIALHQKIQMLASPLLPRNVPLIKWPLLLLLLPPPQSQHLVN